MTHVERNMHRIIERTTQREFKIECFVSLVSLKKNEVQTIPLSFETIRTGVPSCRSPPPSSFCPFHHTSSHTIPAKQIIFSTLFGSIQFMRRSSIDIINFTICSFCAEFRHRAIAPATNALDCINDIAFVMNRYVVVTAFESQ